MRIGILLACEDTSELAEMFPNDGVKFKNLLLPHCEGWHLDVLEAFNSELPADPAEYDGYIVTGSPESVNSRAPWVSELLDFIQLAARDAVPLFGACFGHQAIAKALGGEVEKNAGGWSAGVAETRFLASEDWMSPRRSAIRLHAMHSEQVVRLPAGARIVGTSEDCPAAAYAIGGSIFATQYHPELPAEFMRALIDRVRGRLLSPAEAARALEQIDEGADGDGFAAWIARFFESAARAPERDPDAGPIAERLDAARSICALAGERALAYFRDRAALTIEMKGHQDYVSNADREVELLVRQAIGRQFPDDGIIGEEHDAVSAESRFTWIIDPIDGTASFVQGIPGWTVVLACVRDGETVVGVIYDPVHDEMHYCRRGGGAFLNGEPVRASPARSLGEGTMGIGISSKGAKEAKIELVRLVLADGGNFVRTGSGAQLMAYMACGRLIGYLEEEMNSWDCLAGILLIEEAGGIVFDYGFDSLATGSTPVIAGAPMVAGKVREIARSAFRL